MMSCFLLALLKDLCRTGSFLCIRGVYSYALFKPSLLEEMGGGLLGTLEEWIESHLFFLFLDFLGVGCTEEEGTFSLEGESADGRFKMPVMARSGLILSVRLRFKLSRSLSAVCNFFFKPTMTSSSISASRFILTKSALTFLNFSPNFLLALRSVSFSFSAHANLS